MERGCPQPQRVQSRKERRVNSCIRKHSFPVRLGTAAPPWRKQA